MKSTLTNSTLKECKTLQEKARVFFVFFTTNKITTELAQNPNNLDR